MLFNAFQVRSERVSLTKDALNELQLLKETQKKGHKEAILFTNTIK